MENLWQFTRSEVGNSIVFDAIKLYGDRLVNESGGVFDYNITTTRKNNEFLSYQFNIVVPHLRYSFLFLETEIPMAAEHFTVVVRCHINDGGQKTCEDATQLHEIMKYYITHKDTRGLLGRIYSINRSKF